MRTLVISRTLYDHVTARLETIKEELRLKYGLDKISDTRLMNAVLTKGIQKLKSGQLLSPDILIALEEKKSCQVSLYPEPEIEAALREIQKEKNMSSISDVYRYVFAYSVYGL